MWGWPIQSWGICLKLIVKDLWHNWPRCPFAEIIYYWFLEGVYVLYRTTCNQYQPPVTSPDHLKSAKATSLNYLQPPPIRLQPAQSTLISPSNPITSNHPHSTTASLANIKIVAHTIYTYLFFFLFHALSSCCDCCIPQQFTS